MTASVNPVRLSIVIPAYNEAGRIQPTLEEYTRHFGKQRKGATEILVVLNGCTDGTRTIVESAAARVPQVRMLEFPGLLGKGGAIYEGFQAAPGRVPGIRRRRQHGPGAGDGATG